MAMSDIPQGQDCPGGRDNKDIYTGVLRNTPQTFGERGVCPNLVLRAPMRNLSLRLG